MSVVSVRLSNSLHEKIKDLASSEGVSLNQFINLTLNEKATRIEADRWWSLRGGDITREESLSFLEKVRDDQPEENDRIP